MGRHPLTGAAPDQSLAGSLDDRAGALAATELLDLGAGAGGSLKMAERTFGVRGIGIERLPNLVAQARQKGHAVFEGDLFDLPPSDVPEVRYVTFDNVLEHLPDDDAVERAIGHACALASHVVHIRHPSFENEDYLASLGLKQYWTDWPGVHTAKVAVADLLAMAGRAGVYRTVTFPVMRAFDSDDPTLLPVDAPSGQTRTDRSSYGLYDPARHGPKPSVRLDRPIYFAYDLFLVTAPDLPRIRYRSDPETTQARAEVRWPRSPLASPALVPVRRVASRMIRPIRHRLRRGDRS